MKHTLLALFALSMSVCGQQAFLTTTVTTGPYQRVNVAQFPEVTPLGQTLTLELTGSLPLEIFWLTYDNGFVDLPEAKNQISYKPTKAGWYIALIQNTYTPPVPADATLLPYGQKYLGGGRWKNFDPFTSYMPTRWTYVQ